MVVFLQLGLDRAEQSRAEERKGEGEREDW